MDEARRYQNASGETLDKVTKLYGEALDHLDEIERRIAADPSAPNNHPPVHGKLGGDYATALDDSTTTSDEMKRRNRQGIMTSAEHKNPTKDYHEDGREKK